MRWFLSILLLGLLGVVNAVSSTGNRLLVVLEELAEKDNYSKFFGDLKGKLALGVSEI
jgi:oligosaccharyltransferase complex subunit beta